MIKNIKNASPIRRSQDVTETWVENPTRHPGLPQRSPANVYARSFTSLQTDLMADQHLVRFGTAFLFQRTTSSCDVCLNELGSEPNVGGRMIQLGNVISESLPESARQQAGLFKVPRAVTQTILTKSPGLQSNTVGDYFITHKHTVLVLRCFHPQGPTLTFGQKNNRWFLPFF